MENLLEKKKADLLTADEIAELEAISELDRILTHTNAMLATENAKWNSVKLDSKGVQT